MTAILVSGLLIFVWMSSRNALILQDLTEKRRISLERSKAARARYEREEPDLGPWVAELLGAVGVSPEVLFQEEMPAEFQKLVPVVKGFIDGGGLQKLMSSANAPTEDRSAI